VIKTVVAMKGAKRFKNKGPTGVGDDLMLDNGAQHGNIKEYFRKQMT